MIHVRFGETDVAPVIPKGQADVLLGFEPMETLRAVVDYCGPKTTVIMSSVKIEAISSLTNKAVYPPVEDIINAISSVCYQTYVLNPENALKEIGIFTLISSIWKQLMRIWSLLIPVNEVGLLLQNFGGQALQ